MSRPFRTCTHLDEHGQPKHRHGTRAAYAADGCRCDNCTAANTAEVNRRNREIAYGRYDNGRVDAAPVKARLDALHKAGISVERVSEITGLSKDALYRIRGLYGRGQTKTVFRRTADAVLAIEPDPIRYAHPRRPLDGTGTSRRLQALVAIGWTQTQLAHRLGFPSVNNFNVLVHGGAMVAAETVRDVRALYDDLWDQPQHGTVGAKTSRTKAAKYGWVPPLAWDDDDIDNPKAVPASMKLKPGSAGGSHTNVNYSDVEFLVDGGVGFAEVLSRTGIRDLETLRLGLIRRGRRDLAEGFARQDQQNQISA